ncbi:MAG: aspartate 1-decarboxylase [Deltaproteobacteria bacterium]|nr:aspartate 1-decarboxylase [Deltaproteobacteria bacterium]
MFIRMLKSKIHRAIVSETNLHYEGSITIDAKLMEESGIIPYEEITVWNVTNGERFNTYAVPGTPNSGEIIVNGAAAHRAKKGDLVIIATFAYVEASQATAHRPTIILVDANNRVVRRYSEVACRSSVI